MKKLSKITLEEIKSMSGLSFDQVKDYTTLANMIQEKTGRHIGATTLKRLMGNIGDAREAVEYTLNTVAQYLGFSNWVEYNTHHQKDSDWDYEDDTLYIEQLPIGLQFQVNYLNRVVIFEVILHEGKKLLKVIKAENSSLYPDDLVEIYRIRVGEILEAQQVIRNTKRGNYRTKGEVTEIEIL